MVLESLKRRPDAICRTVPVSLPCSRRLVVLLGVREWQVKRGRGRGLRLRPWSRKTGGRAVHGIIAPAGLDGRRPRPRGYSTVFGDRRQLRHVPLNLTKRSWSAVGFCEDSIVISELR